MARDADELTAVQLDAIAIHALATRDESLIDRRDPVVSALADWVQQIDAGMGETTRFVLPMSTSNRLPVAGRVGRGRRTALIAGSTVLALAVSGGAAAAVTGDPLAAIRAPIKVLGKVNPFTDSESNARDLLPPQTPARAQANKLLADARRALAQGHPLLANRLVTEASALLGDEVSPGQQKRLDHLAEDIASAADRPGKPSDAPGKPSDPPKGQPKTDPPKGQPKTDPPQGQPKTDPPQGQPKTDPPQGQPKTDPPQGQTKTDATKTDPPKGQPPTPKPTTAGTADQSTGGSATSP
jgi:hypothetical protein